MAARTASCPAGGIRRQRWPLRFAHAHGALARSAVHRAMTP
jgi:hypothetical protein